MKPKPQSSDAFELFQSHFDQLLNPDHALVLVAKKMNWPGLEATFVDCYCPDIGALNENGAARAAREEIDPLQCRGRREMYDWFRRGRLARIDFPGAPGFGRRLGLLGLSRNH